MHNTLTTQCVFILSIQIETLHVWRTYRTIDEAQFTVISVTVLKMVKQRAIWIDLQRTLFIVAFCEESNLNKWIFYGIMTWQFPTMDESKFITSCVFTTLDYVSQRKNHGTVIKYSFPTSNSHDRENNQLFFGCIFDELCTIIEN